MSNPRKVSRFLAALVAVLAFYSCAGGARAPAPELTAAEIVTQADAHREAGRLDDAARLYSWVLESFPFAAERADAQFGLARVEMLRGEHLLASSDFSQFRLNHPGHPLFGPALLYESECTELLERERRRIAETKEAERRARLAKSEAVKAIKPAAALPPPPEPLLAVQVLVWDADDWGALARELDALKSAGFNAIIFRAFSNPGDRIYGFVKNPTSATGVYFRTSTVPVVADVLGKVIELSHARGLKVYAWMTSRYADYGLTGERLARWSDRVYDLGTGATLEGKGLDLFNDRVIDHLAAMYADLAKYPIDGLLFQDDLVSRHTDGYSGAAARSYEKRFGRPLEPMDFYENIYEKSGGGKFYVGRYTDRFWEWVRWKNERILDVAERLAGVVRKRRPEAKVAVNFMYEAASSPRNGLAWLSQSISAAHTRGFDYYAIMAYHRQIANELGLSIEQTATLIRRMSRSLYAGAHPLRAVFKLQIRDWDDKSPVSAEELDLMASAVREGARGTGVSPNLAIIPYRGAEDLARLPRSLFRGDGSVTRN